MSKIRTFMGRMKKRLHPLSIRRQLKYGVSRREKHVRMNSTVSRYVDNLLVDSEGLGERVALAAHDDGDRSYLHVPYSEGRFLETFVSATGAKRVLEIGTFKGYSTYFLARSLPKDGKVISIDEDKRYIDETRRFWEESGQGSKIEFRLGMAKVLLEKMASDGAFLGYFDLVFMDADKENYRAYVELAMKVLRPGGSILVDNTLWKGLVAYQNPHDNGARHLREFNEWLVKTYGTSSTIIPAWDGVSVVVKKGQE